MKKRVAILISGGGSNMEALLEAMTDPDHAAEPCLVVSNRPEAGGIAKARARGVATEIVDHKAFADKQAFETALAATLDAHTPDIICLAGFMRLLSAEFVTRFETQILNIHPSLLPAYKGLNTHARALADGVAIHGCTVHVVTPELDTGPILGQSAVFVRPDDTPDTLAARVLTQEHRLYPAVLARFATGDFTPLSLFPDRV